MMDRFKTAKTKVEFALQKFPEARNSDAELLIRVWELDGMVLTDYQRHLIREGRVTNPESVRRMRQKYQEAGMYPATKRVERKRRQYEQEVQQTIKSVRLADMKQSSLLEVLGDVR